MFELVFLGELLGNRAVLPQCFAAVLFRNHVQSGAFDAVPDGLREPGLAFVQRVPILKCLHSMSTPIR